MDASNPCGCLNGGSCVAYEEVICECPYGFQGSRCGDTTIDFDFSQKIDKNESNIVVVVVVTAFITSIILAGLYLIYRRCRKKKKMNRKYDIDPRLYEWRPKDEDRIFQHDRRHSREEQYVPTRRPSERRTSKATVVICFEESMERDCDANKVMTPTRKLSEVAFPSRTPRRKRSLGLSL